MVMKKVLYCVMAVSMVVSCTAPQRPAHNAVAQESEQKVVTAYQFDIRNTIRIINEYDLIATLGHLQRMNDGGSKYYLLEKESISAMIRSTARETYHDLILVNSSGTVLYTMQNETLFAKNLQRFNPESPLYLCFSSSMKGRVHTEKSRALASASGVITYLSTPVTSGDSVQGVLIFQIHDDRPERLSLGGEIGIYGAGGAR